MSESPGEESLFSVPLEAPLDTPLTPNPDNGKYDRKDNLSQTLLGRRQRKPAGDKPGTTRTTKKAVPKAKPGQFVELVEGIYRGAALVIQPFDPVCALGLANCAPQVAEAWDALAQENEWVRKFLFSLTTTSVFTKLFMAHLPLIIAVMFHHVPAAQSMLGAMGQKFADQVAEQMEKGTSE